MVGHSYLHKNVLPETLHQCLHVVIMQDQVLWSDIFSSEGSGLQGHVQARNSWEYYDTCEQVKVNISSYCPDDNVQVVAQNFPQWIDLQVLDHMFS